MIIFPSLTSTFTHQYVPTDSNMLLFREVLSQSDKFSGIGHDGKFLVRSAKSVTKTGETEKGDDVKFYHVARKWGCKNTASV